MRLKMRDQWRLQVIQDLKTSLSLGPSRGLFSKYDVTCSNPKLITGNTNDLARHFYHHQQTSSVLICHIVTKKLLTFLLRNRHTTHKPNGILGTTQMANTSMCFFLSFKLTAKSVAYVDICALVAFHNLRFYHYVSSCKGSRIKPSMFVLAFQLRVL